MAIPRRRVDLSLTDCRVLRAALAVFTHDKPARFRVNATTTRMNYLNRKLSELWPGQAIAGTALMEADGSDDNPI